MILLDVNVLIGIHRKDADKHAELNMWLAGVLAMPPGVSVSELALSGCLRVITHPKVYKNPTPLNAALEFVEGFRALENVRVAMPGPDHWKIFTGLCRDADARGNAIPDAYHAALALEYGYEWVTMDRGFARFPGLRWRHPLH